MFVKSHKNREEIPLKPTQKSATARETINALVLVRRFRLLQTKKIVNPFPRMVRNERTQPKIQNQISILAVKGNSHQLQIINNTLHKYQGSIYFLISRGGRALNEVLYREAVPHRLIPLTLLYTSYAFCISFTDRQYSSHITSLQNYMTLIAVFAPSFEYKSITELGRFVSFTSTKYICLFFFWCYYRPKGQTSIVFHILKLIKPLPFHIFTY